MKTYKITVNGTEYDVVVEETNGAGAVAQSTAPKAAPAKKAPAKKAVATGSEGATKVNAPMPGKILSVKASVGQSVKKGDVIMILEAMKMENEIVAPADGTIASINASEGSSVESGSVLATMN